MNPKSAKNIFISLTICTALVCVLYKTESNYATVLTRVRGLAAERTQTAKYIHSGRSEAMEKEFELDLEDFLPENKDRREIEENLPTKKVESDVEEYLPIKIFERDVDVHTPGKKDKPDVEKPLLAKKDELDVVKTLQAKKDNPDVEKLLPVKKDERNVEENHPRKTDKPDAGKLLSVAGKEDEDNIEEHLPEKKDRPNPERPVSAKKLKYDVDKLIPGKKLEREVDEPLQRKIDKPDVEMLLPANKSEPNVTGKKESSVEILTEESIAESIREKLRFAVANIEEDVFRMNVIQILKSMPVVPFDENRLVHKIQRAQRDPKYRCVIRISKYCGSRCHHYITSGHEGDEGAETFYQSQLEWKKFRCDFAQPCQVETRFVGNVASDITDMLNSSDVIFFIASLHGELQLMRLTASRPPGQLWTLYSRESPIHDHEYAPTGLTGNPFNLTMTHSRQADIYFPYCTIKRKQVRPPPFPKKSKLITSMASNCHLLSWRRREFVEELEKHLAVDAYGKCGSLGRLSDPDKVIPTYKFYLALENSECKDYITEKLWKTCLLQGIVPIVYGARREDYEQTLPKNSFIYIEDFSNMSAFVNFIHELDSDNTLYEKYFEWRKEEQVFCLQDRRFTMLSPEANMWYLLRKLIHLYIHPETSWQKRTPNFTSWWHGQCPDLTIEKNVLGFNVHPERQRMKNGQRP